MSRNSDRLGAQSVQSSAPPPQITQNNDANPFSFVVPTEFVELPSKGKYYPEHHPLHNQETIELKHMTAKEEDILTSRALLKKGVALDRLLDSIIIDKRIKGENLFVGDRNAILLAARISGYGSDYSTKITCPSCEQAKLVSLIYILLVYTRVMALLRMKLLITETVLLMSFCLEQN